MTERDPARVPTGAQKRATEDRLLRQVYVRLRELHTRTGELLDMIGRVVVAREDRDLEHVEDDVRAATSSTPPPPAPRTMPGPFDRRTVAQPAFTSTSLVDAVTERWDAAETEADRENVLAMLRRGAETGLLTPDELAATEQRLRDR